MDKVRRKTIAHAALWLLVALAGRAEGRTLGMVLRNGGAGGVMVFDADTLASLGVLPMAQPPGGALADCSITADQKLGFMTDLVGRVWVIDLMASPPGLAPGPNPIPISNPGEDTALSPDGKFLLVCDGAGSRPIAVVDVAARREVSTFSLDVDCSAVDVCSDGSVLVGSALAHSVSRLTLDGAGRLADTGERLSTGPAPFTDPNNVHCAPGGKSGIVVRRIPHEIQSFTIPGLHRAAVRTLSGTGYYGLSGVFSPGGERFFARSDGGAVDAFAYDPATAELGPSPLFSFPVSSVQPYYGVDQLAIHPDGTRLYAPEAVSLRVYAASTGAQIAAATGDFFFNQASGVCLPAPAAGESRVEIAVQPASINPRSRGVLTVSVLTGAGFDASEIDPATVRLGPAGAGIERASFADVDGDGDLDLVLKVRRELAGIRCGDTAVVLVAETFGGGTVEGEAPIRTVGCR